MDDTSKNIASLDIGSHTARMLVSQWSKTEGLKPLAKRRAFVRLAEDFEAQEPGTIKPAAQERVLLVLEDFARTARELCATEIVAVATGVVREARNQLSFLEAIKNRTGIRVKALSGEEEASLTGLGVRHALHIEREPFVIFDLGGGSTEFLTEVGGTARAYSLPLGAALYTHRFLRSDPPFPWEIESLEREISEVLQASVLARPSGKYLLVGTGGTVTTLASLIHKVGVDQINAERMNGLILTMADLEGLLGKMKKMARQERVDLLGLEAERAEVILAGFLIVMKIMQDFHSSELTVSLSDLLEGALLDFVTWRRCDANERF